LWRSFRRKTIPPFFFLAFPQPSVFFFLDKFLGMIFFPPFPRWCSQTGFFSPPKKGSSLLCVWRGHTLPSSCSLRPPPSFVERRTFFFFPPVHGSSFPEATWALDLKFFSLYSNYRPHRPPFRATLLKNPLFFFSKRPPALAGSTFSFFWDGFDATIRQTSFFFPLQYESYDNNGPFLPPVPPFSFSSPLEHPPFRPLRWTDASLSFLFLRPPLFQRQNLFFFFSFPSTPSLVATSPSQVRGTFFINPIGYPPFLSGILLFPPLLIKKDFFCYRSRLWPPPLSTIEPRFPF